MSILGSLFCISFSNAQDNVTGSIRGTLKMDNSWSREIYLSHIPTLDDLYTMSNEMVISKAKLDSLGNFFFDLSFLPEKDNLFRLHVVKSGDSKYSLTIGGKDENHMFLVANRFSNIHFSNDSNPPFRRVGYKNSEVNSAFQNITEMVFYNDSIASESGLAKRRFIKAQMKDDLLTIADSASHPLISLYALHNMDFKSDYKDDPSFYHHYLEKWSGQKNNYFSAFRSSIQYEEPTSNLFVNSILALLLLAVGFALGKFGFKKKDLTKELSVRERKIYEMLQTGASNQEIANSFNIGINTVKSHVSRILSKMKVKSRKEILNL